MTKLSLALPFLSVFPALAQDTLPRDLVRPKDPTPQTMKAGDKACAFPVTASREGHVWMSPRGLSGVPKKQQCFAALVEKLKDGWMMTVYIKVTPGLTDAEYKSFGWTRMTQVVSGVSK